MRPAAQWYLNFASVHHNVMYLLGMLVLEVIAMPIKY